MFNEDRIINEIENSLIRSLHKDECFKLDYGNRIDVSDKLKEAYKKVDFEKVYKLVTEKLEETIAEKIVNKVITEMGTDMKKLFENATIRDDLKFLLRKNIELLLEKVK